MAGGGRRLAGADTWGPRVSERKKIRVYRFGFAGKWAVGCFSSWAEGFPGVHFIFLFVLFFFLFCFLISFVTFAKMLQNHSNHFQKFSKIQGIKVGQ
jgi:hypothetical protein